jgi:acetate kinase
MQAILVLNSGSSSVKFAVYEVGKPAPVLLFRGMLDWHTHESQFVIKDATGKPVGGSESSSGDLKADLATTLLDRIEPLLEDKEVVAVGHRIVHGGPDFSVPVRINAEIIRKLERLIPLAPLHQPDVSVPFTASSRPGRSSARSHVSIPPSIASFTRFTVGLRCRSASKQAEFVATASMGFRSNTLPGS